MKHWIAQIAAALLVYVAPSYGSVTATLTSDNHYGLYYGKADGSGLSFVGRNEKGTEGSTGLGNWNYPETFSSC